MKLTPKQIELASTYLAMSDICTLDPYRKLIVDMPTLERYVHQAWENAVTGTMEGYEGGYDDRNEGRAIRSVQREINSFKRDFKNRDRADYWVETLMKEVPFLFDAIPETKTR